MGFENETYQNRCFFFTFSIFRYSRTCSYSWLLLKTLPGLVTSHPSPPTVERNEKVEPRLDTKVLAIASDVIIESYCIKDSSDSAMNDYLRIIKFLAIFHTTKDVRVLPRAKFAVVGRANPIVGND